MPLWWQSEGSSPTARTKRLRAVRCFTGWPPTRPHCRARRPPHPQANRIEAAPFWPPRRAQKMRGRPRRRDRSAARRL